MKSGFITILGRPNVGKSTFLNTVLKQKICIMSDKPQTTRNVIQGIHTESDVQMIFMDTPGIHKPKHELGKMMTEMAYQTIRSVDVVLFMISAVDPIGTGDRMIIEHLKQCNVPVYLLINKIDLLKSKMAIDKVILDYMNLLNFKGVFPISAKDNLNIDHLLDDLKNLLPEGPMYFPEDQITDHPERFIVSELIREQVLKLTSEEVPHSVAVVVESMRPNEERPDIIDCYATIICERASQKGIIIGKEGQMLKKIGTNARKEIINLLGSKTHLELWVKVKKDWRNKQMDLKNFGYNLDEF